MSSMGPGILVAASRGEELPLGDPEPPRSVDFGLVVGVDHYPRFRSLRGAVADATRFHDWLVEPDGGGVAPERARLVVSSPNPAAPLQDEVDERLLEIVVAADALGGGRRLYFHFSEHGAGSPDESGEDVALLLAKWSRNLARLALSTDEYRGTIGGMGLFEQVRSGDARSTDPRRRHPAATCARRTGGPDPVRGASRSRSPWHSMWRCDDRPAATAVMQRLAKFREIPDVAIL